MRGVLSRIPVRLQKPVAKGLLVAAFFAADFGALNVMGFSKSTETSGWLWWQETTEIPLSERLPYLVTGVGLFAVAVICVAVAIRLITLQGSLKKYSAILTGIESIPVQKLADITNSSARKVYGDIEAMIGSGMISDFYLDHSIEQVVSKKYVPKTSHKTVITCSGCGGNTEIIVGITRPCTYCGEPLVLERR